MRFDEETEKQLALLKDIHYICRKFFDNNEHEAFANYIELNLLDNVDANIYKTILIASKDFKNHPVSGPARAKLYRKYHNYMCEQHINFYLYNPHPDDK